MSFSVWNLSDPKDKFSFHAFIMNYKVILCCILYNPGQEAVTQRQNNCELNSYSLNINVPLTAHGHLRVAGIERHK